MARRYHDLGYLQDIDLCAMPNVEKNLLPQLRHAGVRPGPLVHGPYQSGMTGLIVRTDLAPDITSINDLFDPKYKGKVDLLSELRDTVPLVMKADGIDPRDRDQGPVAGDDPEDRGRDRLGPDPRHDR